MALIDYQTSVFRVNEAPPSLWGCQECLSEPPENPPAGRNARESRGASLEPGVRSQESGVRSQESGVGSRESGVGSRESRVRVYVFAFVFFFA